MWTQGREVVSVCGGQRTEEGGQDVMSKGCRHTVGDKKSKNGGSTGKKRKDRLRVDGCMERAGLVSALIRAVYMDLGGPVENPPL
jgi:hypothetical protein